MTVRTTKPPMKLVVRSRLDNTALQQIASDWDITCVPRTPDRWVLEAADLARMLQDVDVLVTEADPVTADVLASCPRLKAVVVCRGNPVNVDVPAATAAGVLVIHTPGRNAVAVAELCVALMIIMARRIVPAWKAVDSGEWARAPRGWAYNSFQGEELSGKTAGLLGLGAIGRHVATRLRAFQMRVRAHDPFVSSDVAQASGVELVSLRDLLSESDFVSIHVHVTRATQNMIGSAELALMKSSAFLINTARAGVVVEDAMLEVLRGGRIAGAALDVFHREPLRDDDPLLGLPNVVLLPHIGGATIDVVRHQWEIVVESLRALRNGRVPARLFNPEVMQNPASAPRLALL